MPRDHLVGRERERAALAGWVGDALAGTPSLVLCGGEPGIGKTRLADEAAALAGEAGAVTRWARAHEGVGNPPYWLWRQLLRSGPTGPGAGWADLPATTDADPGGDRFALFDAVTRRVFGLAEQSGLVLVIEDAQWADEPSLLLLRYLTRELRHTRVLVLVTHRTVGAGPPAAWGRVLPDLAREPVTQRLVLAGLDQPDTARLVEAIAGVPVPPAVAADVHRRTGGNPFFVRELARVQAAGGDLAVRHLPESLVDVVAQRAAGLSAPARQALVAAAVLGEQFSVAVMAAIAGQPPMACLPLLEEAEAAGLLVPTDTPGDWRFSHALVCEVVEAGAPADERARLHRAAAETIERLYGEQVEDRLADIARHWAAASPDDPSPAVDRARRAGQAAMRALAYEESARLYRLAIDVGGPAMDPGLRCRLLIDMAAAFWQATDIESCRATTGEAVALARRLGRPDLIAAAALGVEPIGSLDWDLDLRRWCDEALAGVGTGDAALRARLLGRAAEAAVYVDDWPAAEAASREALRLAEGTADPAAAIATLKSRQLCLSAPEHVEERRALADSMAEIGVTLHRPREEMWGRLWRIDTFWERGDLPAIAAELPRLRWCVDHVGGPIARWHLLIVRAALAAALGRYDEGLGLGREAFETVRATNHPTAVGSYMAFLCAVARHVGPERVTASQPPDLMGAPPADQGEVRETIFVPVATALMLALAGRPDEALGAYRSAGPPEAWRPPPYFRVLAWAYGSLLAVMLGQRQDAELFHERLSAEPGRFVVAGAGTSSYVGPVELHRGRAAAFLGRLDEAVADLESALAYCRRVGADGFAVEAACELADALAHRAEAGDVDRARGLLARAATEAAALAMPPWQRRAEEQLAALAGEPSPGPLSARQAEVAGLVAQGMTNRQIATALFISERTAQTHVQHILTRLGFSTRSQIAAWVTRGDGAANT